jgi:hypothetical protein
MILFQRLSSPAKLNELNQALLGFHHLMWTLVDIGMGMETIHTLLDGAYIELKQYRDVLSVQESLCINWGEYIQQFWDDVCPNGYSIVHNYESKGYATCSAGYTGCRAIPEFESS